MEGGSTEQYAVATEQFGVTGQQYGGQGYAQSVPYVGIQYILVADNEEGKDAMELPTEEDGSLMLGTVKAQFENAIGLKHKNDAGTAWRGVRLVGDALKCPPEGWGSRLYVATLPQKESLKRKLEETPNPLSNSSNRYPSSGTTSKTSEVIVLGLPYELVEEDLREYFEKIAPVENVQVKRDMATKRSKGFGFVRFKNREDAVSVTEQSHMLSGRKIAVKFPDRKETPPVKLYVANLPSDATDDDILHHFETFGDIAECYIPNPRRGFAMVTFKHREEAKLCLRAENVLKDTTMKVKYADDKRSQLTHRANEQPSFHETKLTAAGLVVDPYRVADVDKLRQLQAYGFAATAAVESNPQEERLRQLQFELEELKRIRYR